MPMATDNEDAGDGSDTKTPVERVVVEGDPTSDQEAASLFEEFAEQVGVIAAAPKPKESPVEDSGDDGVATPPPPPPAPTQAPSPSPAPTPAPAPSMFTADEIAALRELPGLMKSMGGRMASMQSALDKGRKAADDAGAEAPTEKQITDAGKSTDKWKKLQKDFPEWAEGIEEFMASKTGGGASDETQRMIQEANARAEAADKRAAALETQFAEVRIESAHPKWKATIQQPEWKSWYAGLAPAEREEVRVAKTPEAIIGALDKFKQTHQQSTPSAPTSPAAARGTAPAKQNLNPALAAAATQRGSRSAPPKSEDDMSEEELFNHYAKQG